MSIAQNSTSRIGLDVAAILAFLTVAKFSNSERSLLNCEIIASVIGHFYRTKELIQLTTKSKADRLQTNYRNMGEPISYGKCA